MIYSTHSLPIILLALDYEIKEEILQKISMEKLNQFNLDILFIITSAQKKEREKI